MVVYSLKYWAILNGLRLYFVCPLSFGREKNSRDFYGVTLSRKVTADIYIYRLYTHISGKQVVFDIERSQWVALHVNHRHRGYAITAHTKLRPQFYIDNILSFYDLELTNMYF